MNARRVLVILVSAAIVVAAGLYLSGMTMFPVGGGVQFGGLEENWMRVLPANVALPVKVYYIRNMAGVGGLEELVSGSQTQILGVKYPILKVSDIDALVVPGKYGCVADCGGRTPLIVVIYQLKEGRGEELARELGKSRLLRYKAGNFTVFYSVGRTLTGEYNGDIVSFAGIGDSILFMVSGEANSGRDKVQEIVDLWSGEYAGFLSDETLRGALKRAVGGTPLMVKITRGSVEGSRFVVLSLHKEGGSAGGRMIIAFDTESSASAAQQEISNMISRGFSVAGVRVSDPHLSRDGRYYVIEFSLPGETLAEIVTKL